MIRYFGCSTFLFSAPVAQLDRAFGFEPKGREFESLRAHHNQQLTGSERFEGKINYSARKLNTIRQQRGHP
jgi:hypothetical protein